MDAIIALLAILIFVCGLLALRWFKERRDPDVLPEPDDPRLRNVNGIREWRRRRALIERYEEVTQ